MIRILGHLAFAVALLGAQDTTAWAAEIKVFSTIGVQAALEELTPTFEKASGHKLSVTWATAALLVKRVQGGETADIMVLTKQSLETLVKEGKASTAPDAVFASSGMAMVVKAGSPKPDITTPDALKQTLLKAKAIAYSNPAYGGASGVYLAKLLEKMGIAEEMKAKTRHPPPSGNAAHLVLSGEADLAIQQEPEVISVTGVDLVGPLPGDLNNITAYAAGPGAGTAQGDAARTLIKFLHSPEAQAVFKKRGLKPA